jgi:hypothetical protein
MLPVPRDIVRPRWSREVASDARGHAIGDDVPWYVAHHNSTGANNRRFADLDPLYNGRTDTHQCAPSHVDIASEMRSRGNMYAIGNDAFVVNGSGGIHDDVCSDDSARVDDGARGHNSPRSNLRISRDDSAGMNGRGEQEATGADVISQAEPKRAITHGDEGISNAAAAQLRQHPPIAREGRIAERSAQPPFGVIVDEGHDFILSGQPDDVRHDAPVATGTPHDESRPSVHGATDANRDMASARCPRIAAACA